MLQCVYPFIFLLTFLVFVCSSQAGSGSTKSVRGCCSSTGQISGLCKFTRGSETSEYEYYADYRKKKALNIAEEEIKLYDFHTKTLYIFTKTGCMKMPVLGVISECIKESEDMVFVSRYQARAVNGKGWSWKSQWKATTVPSTKPGVQANPDDRITRTMHYDEETCFNEHSVTETSDGVIEVYQMVNIRAVVDDPTLFDLDVSECVDMDLVKTKSEL